MNVGAYKDYYVYTVEHNRLPSGKTYETYTLHSSGLYMAYAVVAAAKLRRALNDARIGRTSISPLGRRKIKAAKATAPR